MGSRRRGTGRRKVGRKKRRMRAKIRHRKPRKERAPAIVELGPAQISCPHVEWRFEPGIAETLKAGSLNGLSLEGRLRVTHGAGVVAAFTE